MDYSLFIGIHYMEKCDQSHDEFLLANGARLSPLIQENSIQRIPSEENSVGSQTHNRVVYHFGLIDIFTSFSMKKKVENLFKRVVYDQQDISSVNPELYANRLYCFIKDHLTISQPQRIN